MTRNVVLSNGPERLLGTLDRGGWITVLSVSRCYPRVSWEAANWTVQEYPYPTRRSERGRERS